MRISLLGSVAEGRKEKENVLHRSPFGKENDFREHITNGELDRADYAGRT
jgi:hypothetical protein